MEYTVSYHWLGNVLLTEKKIHKNDWEEDEVLYIHEPGSFLPAMQVRTGTFGEEEIQYYNLDHLGTPRELTDENGKVVWTGEYDAWGRAQTRSHGEVNCKIRYQGQYYDEETGLHYNRHRYYDPSTGHYTSRDPIGLAGGENPSQYAPNTTSWIDPLGLMGSSGKSSATNTPKNPWNAFQQNNKFANSTEASKAYSQKKVDEVISETLNSNQKNIVSKQKLTADQALAAGEQFVGPGYSEIGQPGSGVFRSADGTRQFRIDDGSLAGSHAPHVPHVHLETYAVGANKPTVNNHIPFTEE